MNEMPTPNDTEKLAIEIAAEISTRPEFAKYESPLILDIVRATLAARERAQPAKAPDGYAYRYYCDPWQTGTVIRFNNGEEINGSKPIEAIPFYYGQPSAQPASVADGAIDAIRNSTHGPGVTLIFTSQEKADRWHSQMTETLQLQQNAAPQPSAKNVPLCASCGQHKENCDGC